ncbi:MAG: PQQ-binding-like beta-propeller repeat protein [Polyangiales bacterium]
MTWTNTLPADPDPTSGYYIAGLAADASDAAYIVLGPNFGADVANLIRVDGATGAFEWNTSFVPASEGNGLPLLLASGDVEIVATGAHYTPAIDHFDAASGAVSTLTLELVSVGQDVGPAIGADGAKYFSYTANQGTAQASSVVSRLNLDGTLAWTSVDLGTLGPSPGTDNDVFPSSIALGRDDLVVVATQVITTPFNGTVVIALDSTTGAARWANAIPGELVGGPAVAADGSVVALIGAPSSKLFVFEVTGATRRAVDLGEGTFQIFAIALDGTVIVGADDREGVAGLTAVNAAGVIVWNTRLAGIRTVTIDAKGTLLTSTSTGIVGLDLTTGQTKWTLAAPHQGSCVTGFTLTSAGGIVAAQCDSTVFGASD